MRTSVLNSVFAEISANLGIASPTAREEVNDPMGPSLTVVTAPTSGRNTGRTEPPPASDGRIALRVGEAAEAISVCRATFWRLMRAGEIPVVRIGGMKRIMRRDLEAWPAANKEP